MSSPDLASGRYVKVGDRDHWRERALVAEAALANRLAVEAAIATVADDPEGVLPRIIALLDARDARIRDLESQLLTAMQAPGTVLANPASVAWYEMASAPADTWLLVAAQFAGPDDWRVKIGNCVDGKWNVLGASWRPTRWTHMPASPGAPTAMFALQPARDAV